MPEFLYDGINTAMWTVYWAGIIAQFLGQFGDILEHGNRK